MATVTYDVCDRCGERIVRRKGFNSIVEITKTIKITKFVCGDGSERTHQLCTDCSRSLESFLDGETASLKS